MASAADTQDEDGETKRHLVNKVKRKHMRTLPGSAQANIDIAPIFEGIDLYTSITRARFEELCPHRPQDTLKIVVISVTYSVSKPKFDNLFGCRVTITKITEITPFFEGINLYTSITRASFEELCPDQSTDLERSAAEKADVERAAAEKADVDNVKMALATEKVDVDEVKIASAADTQDQDEKSAAKDATPAAGTQDKTQLECPRPLEDMDEVNRLVVQPLPGKTSATAPPLIDIIPLGTTLGSSAARLSPQLAVDQVAGLPPLLEDQATAYRPKLQPRLPQVQFTTVQPHKSLLLSNLSTEGQAGAHL